MTWAFRGKRRKPPKLINGYRSRAEAKLGEELGRLGVPFEYEKVSIPYKVERNASYKPDFRLTKNGIIIEYKGWFQGKDRTKHVAIKKQHPELDIRFIFGNSSNRLSKTSRTTYAAWCEKHGFKYADKTIPKEWLNENRGQETL